MKKLLAKGIFSWDGAERRSDRYGSIHLTSTPFEGSAVAVVEYNTELLNKLDEKRVRLTCTVIESRKSGHIGDLSHGFFPSTPTVGEIIDLGVGRLGQERGWDSMPDILLRPALRRDDRGELQWRETFWMDPRKLYRLHDQTVEVYVEATRAKFSRAPNFKKAAPEAVFVEPDKSGNNVQVKSASNEVRIPPRIEPLGGGLFALSHDYQTGDHVALDRKS